jgi:predicted deacetylase
MQTPRPALVVSIHDVSPLTREMVTRILRDLSELELERISLLVIPNHHKMAPMRQDTRFCEWLRSAARRHEIVLHGYFHMRSGTVEGWWDSLVTQWYTAGEGEFYDLPESEALFRLEKAKRDFATAGVSARGFIAPAWLLGVEAEIAVRNTGFDYTTRLRTFKDLVTGRETASQSLVWSIRAAWRRLLSLLWNGLLARQLWAAPLLRIGLHPPDWNHSSIRQQALGLIRAALVGREGMTYEDWLLHLRSER